MTQDHNTQPVDCIEDGLRPHDQTYQCGTYYIGFLCFLFLFFNLPIPVIIIKLISRLSPALGLSRDKVNYFEQACKSSVL